MENDAEQKEKETQKAQKNKRLSPEKELKIIMSGRPDLLDDLMLLVGAVGFAFPSSIPIFWDTVSVTTTSLTPASTPIDTDDGYVIVEPPNKTQTTTTTSTTPGPLLSLFKSATTTDNSLLTCYMYCLSGLSHHSFSVGNPVHKLLMQIKMKTVKNSMLTTIPYSSPALNRSSSVDNSSDPPPTPPPQ